MKTKLLKGIVLLALGFAGLFLLRMGYGYYVYPPGSSKPKEVWQEARGGSFVFSRKNYASSKGKRSVPAGVSAARVDQKYEKIGTVTSRTKQFDEDEKKIRALIEKHQALIQYERSHGLPDRRSLNLAIGVVPDKFDAMVAEVKTIGEPSSIQIDKKDKTNEYQKLSAEKLSLEKTRDALIELKNAEAKVDELIGLENRILEIEQQIQSMGVSLGDYDAENEFCTIKFSLNELRKDTIKAAIIPFVQRIKVAFHWSVVMYARLVFILFAGIVAIFCVLFILDKLKWLPQMLEDGNGKDA